MATETKTLSDLASLTGGSADAAVAWAVVIDTNELQDAEAALEAAAAALQPSTVAHRAAYRLVYSAGNA